MSDAIEEIRCALAMRDAGYAVLLDHETSAELLRQYDIAMKALEEIEDLGADGVTAARLGNIAHAALISLRVPVSAVREKS